MALRPRSSVGDRRQAGAARRPKNAAAPSRGANDMSIQLQLSEDWQRDAAWRDPLNQLRQLEQDKLDAKHEIRLVLDDIARSTGSAGAGLMRRCGAMSTICSTISSTKMKRRTSTARSSVRPLARHERRRTPAARHRMGGYLRGVR